MSDNSKIPQIAFPELRVSNPSPLLQYQALRSLVKSTSQALHEDQKKQPDLDTILLKNTVVINLEELLLFYSLLLKEQCYDKS